MGTVIDEIGFFQMQTPQLIGITFGFCEFRWLINLNFLRSWLTMSRFSRRKIAASLAFASLLSGRASAADTNNAQNPQTVAAVGGLLVTINLLSKSPLRTR